MTDTPPIKFWDCDSEAETLEHTTIKEAVEVYAEMGITPEDWPETVTVYGWAPMPLPAVGRIADKALDGLSEWEEIAELLDPEGDGFDDLDHPAIHDAAAALAQAVHAHATVRACEIVEERKVNVRDVLGGNAIRQGDDMKTCKCGDTVVVMTGACYHLGTLTDPGRGSPIVLRMLSPQCSIVDTETQATAHDDFVFGNTGPEYLRGYDRGAFGVADRLKAVAEGKDWPGAHPNIQPTVRAIQTLRQEVEAKRRDYVRGRDGGLEDAARIVEHMVKHSDEYPQSASLFVLLRDLAERIRAQKTE